MITQKTTLYRRKAFPKSTGNSALKNMVFNTLLSLRSCRTRQHWRYLIYVCIILYLFLRSYIKLAEFYGSCSKSIEFSLLGRALWCKSRFLTPLILPFCDLNRSVYLLLLYCIFTAQKVKKYCILRAFY